MADDFGPISTPKPAGRQPSKGSCRGICVRFKASRPPKGDRYAAGQKRCQICDLFINYEDIWCPCCGYRLRIKPRNIKSKERYRAKLEAELLKKAHHDINDALSPAHSLPDTPPPTSKPGGSS